MKLKNIVLASGLGLALISSLSSYSFANTTNSNILSVQKAKQIMLKKVPGGKIVEFKLDADDRIPEYEGTVIKGNYEYDIDINAKTGSVIKFEKEKKNSGYSKVKISQSKAKQIMLKKVPGGKIVEFKLDIDDRTPEYEGSLVKGNYKYEIDVNANTGKITKFEKEKKNSNSSTVKISQAKAKDIMLKKVPGAKIIEFKLDIDDDKAEYEGTLVKGNYEYEMEVNANTGKLTKFEKEYKKNNNNSNNNNGVKISQAKAKDIMLKKVPGAKIVEFELDIDDDGDEAPKYEGKLIKGNYEYEIEVDANTGKILDFDVDYDD